jgi:hypothetical protein
MIPFPFFLFPYNSDTATTIEKERIEWINYNNTTHLDDRKILNLTDLFDVKNNKLTTATIDPEIDRSNPSSEIFQNVFSRNYDIHVPLLINKTFHFKGKVKSVKRYKPTIYI